MIVENAFTVAAPMDAVFDALRDVRTVLPCLDARVVEVVDGHTARGELTVPMGDATMVFSGTLRVGEADRQAGAITFELVGHGAGDAAMQGRMAVRLRESAGATTASVQADVDVSDAPVHVDDETTSRAAHTLLARLGAEVAGRVARREEPAAVRGTVRLMAPPVPTPAQPRGIPALVAAQLRRRPWLVPAALMGATALVLVLGRRRGTAAG
jgi:carbon monoxide dehydrogenase subunit G